jgi:hypothetical protein
MSQKKSSAQKVYLPVTTALAENVRDQKYVIL